MDEEIQEYLNNISHFLNGQLRGAMNLKAKEENLELIQLTLNDVWEKCQQHTLIKAQDQKTLEKLQQTLKSLDHGTEKENS